MTGASAKRYSEQEENCSNSSDLEDLDSERDLHQAFKNLSSKFNLFSYELKLLLAQIEIISTWVKHKFDTQLFDKESIALHHVSDYREIREIASLLTSTVSVHEGTARCSDFHDKGLFVEPVQDSDQNVSNISSSESDDGIQQFAPVKKSTQRSQCVSPRKYPLRSPKKSKSARPPHVLYLSSEIPIENNVSPKTQRREKDISHKSPGKRGKSASPSKPQEITAGSHCDTEFIISPRKKTSPKEKPTKSSPCNLSNALDSDSMEVAETSEPEFTEQVRQKTSQMGSKRKNMLSPKKTPQKKSPRKNLVSQFLSPPTAKTSKAGDTTLSPVQSTSKNSSPKSKSPNRVSPKKGSPRKAIVNVAQIDLPSSSSSTKNFNCDECGKTLATASNLREHKKIHRDIRPFKCDQCGKSFRRNQKLKLHLLIHQGEEGKQYQCGYCGKLFLQRRDLIRHERIHTGEKPYQCPNCPKSFSIKQHLTYHIRTHTGERPYKCDECEKSFSQPNTLRLHKKLHQGIKYVAPSRLKKRKAKLDLKARVPITPTVVVTISPTKQSTKSATQSNLRQFFIPTSDSSSVISNVSFNSVSVQEQGDTSNVSANYTENS